MCNENTYFQEKFDVSCVYNTATQELMRSIRANLDSLLNEHKQELRSMNLAVAHSLSRYRVRIYSYIHIYIRITIYTYGDCFE